MFLKQILVTATLLAPLWGVVHGVLAEEEHDHEHRQHDAHVHGIGALNLALEGQEVHIELGSPAANIIGFEHAPSSEADHAAIDKAVALLKEGNRLFKFNDNAGCSMKTAKVVSAFIKNELEEHEKHEELEKDDEHEKEAHSDIEANYHFECTAPDKLSQLTVELFEAFPGTEKLKVQYIIKSKQGGVELTAAKHVIKF